MLDASRTHLSGSLLVIAALLTVTAACDGPVGPAGEDGQDGNANVTMYVFDGVDFTSLSGHYLCFGGGVTAQEQRQSSWNAYLVFGSGSNAEYHHVPGTVSSTSYGVYHWFNDVCGSAQPVMWINVDSGTGHEVDEIRVIRTEPSNIEDCSGGGCLRTSSEPVVPEGLDMTDYDAVIEYFSLTEEDIVRM